jgi:hypothetical protein
VLPSLVCAQAPLSKSKQRKLKRHQNAAGDCPAAEAAAAGGDPPAGDAAAAVAARAALLSKLKGSWGSIVQVPAGSFLLEAVYNSLVSGCHRACIFWSLPSSKLVF